MNSQVTTPAQKPNPRITFAHWRSPDASTNVGEFVKRLLHSETLLLLLFFLLHILLALVIKRSSALALLHAVGTLLAGLWLAGSSTKLHRVAIWGAYVSGAEVLWRMTKTPVPWEFCKYAISLVFLVALVRSGQFKARLAIFLYFVCLLPSLVMPMTNVSLNAFIDQISFNLSGPLALVISLWFFSQVQLTTIQTNRLFCALICPVLGIGVLALRGIATAKELVFSTESNWVTSGGGGPNQVSGMLALGALAALVWLQSKETPFVLRVLLLCLMLYFTAQSALTFSRSGVYLIAGGLLLALPLMLQNRRLRLQLLAGLALVFLAINFYLLPRLDAFTQGMLKQRFSETQTTQRGQIMSEDWRLFTENPLFGVGPGQAKFHRRGIFVMGETRVAAHNEFTRLLAEHGIWGVLALLSLLFLTLQHFQQAATLRGRLLMLTMTFWGFGFIFMAAMRVVAPSYVLGLTAARLVDRQLPSAAAAAKRKR
jgi:O-antigen ligase